MKLPFWKNSTSTNCSWKIRLFFSVLNIFSAGWRWLNRRFKYLWFFHIVMTVFFIIFFLYSLYFRAQKISLFGKKLHSVDSWGFQSTYSKSRYICNLLSIICSPKKNFDKLQISKSFMFLADSSNFVDSKILT